MASPGRPYGQAEAEGLPDVSEPIDPREVKRMDIAEEVPDGA